MGLNQSMMLGKSFCPFSLYTRLQCVAHGTRRKTYKGKYGVTAKRGAERNTEHNLICMKLWLKRSPHGKGAKRAKNKRYDVERLIAGTGANEETHTTVTLAHAH